MRRTVRFSMVRLRVVGALLVLGACGGGGDDGGTTNPPPAATLDNIVVTPTTLSLGAGQSQTITASGRSAAGANLSGVTFGYSSSNQSVATVSATGLVLALTAGTATITVTGTLGGVSKSATTALTVTGALPSAVTVVAGAASNDFTPANVALARGGTVTWTFGALIHNVDFEGRAGAPANIGNVSNTSIQRTFANAGTFGYVCSLHGGMNGTILVP